MSDYTGSMAWMNDIEPTIEDNSKVGGRLPNHQVTVDLKDICQGSVEMILRKVGEQPDYWELIGGENETVIKGLSYQYNMANNSLSVSTVEKQAVDNFISALSRTKASYKYVIR